MGFCEPEKQAEQVLFCSRPQLQTRAQSGQEVADTNRYSGAGARRIFGRQVGGGEWFCNKVQEFMCKMSDQPGEFKGRIVLMSMFNDISWRSQDNEQECESDAKFVSISARRLLPGRWSFLGLESEKKWFSSHDKQQGEWDRVAELMLIKFEESGHPVFRATSPLSRGKLQSEGGGKLRFSAMLMGMRLKLFFAQFFCFNQLIIHGAVSKLCEEYSIFQIGTGRFVVAKQSDPFFFCTSRLLEKRSHIQII